MGESLSKLEWIFRAAMILLGMAGLAFVTHRLLVGQRLENENPTMAVLKTGSVLEGPDGHGYQYVAAANISWDDARDGAQARSWRGMPGYLGTIDNKAEFDFVVGTLFRKQYPDVTYLGGRQTAPGDWRWVTGPDGGADGGKGKLFWRGYADGKPQNGAFSDWMDTAFGTGGKWDVHKVCCVTLFSYHRPQFSNSLGTGDRDEGVSGYLVEYGR